MSGEDADMSEDPSTSDAGGGDQPVLPHDVQQLLLDKTSLGEQRHH